MTDSATSAPVFPPDLSPQRIAPGATQAWLADGRVVSYELASVMLDVLEAVAATAITLINEWPPDRPYLALYDVTAPMVALTPRLRQLAMQVGATRPQLYGRAALVIPPGATGQRFKDAAIMLDREADRPIKAFFHRQKALAWLLELA